MNAVKISPAIHGRGPTYQEVKDQILASGKKPLRQEDVESPDSMMVFLGGERPVLRDIGLDWDQVARTTGFSYPVE